MQRDGFRVSAYVIKPIYTFAFLYHFLHPILPNGMPAIRPCMEADWGPYYIADRAQGVKKSTTSRNNGCFSHNQPNFAEELRHSQTWL